MWTAHDAEGMFSTNCTILSGQNALSDCQSAIAEFVLDLGEEKWVGGVFEGCIR